MLIRHGQTEWSESGRHTSYTDIPLTTQGEGEATALGQRLTGRPFAAVISSPRQRALRTAELAGLMVSDVDEDLTEWNYGEYEGLTTPEIHRDRPDWDIWRDGCPEGETPAEAGARLDRVLAKATALLPRGDVALIGHGHCLRVATARWVGLPAASGGLFKLGTATLSELGHEHGHPVVVRWNVPV